MIISLIWDGDYPWDVRIEKVANTLVSHGHEVHLICRNVGRREEYESIDGIEIHRLPKLSFLPFRVHKALSFPAFFNPFWLFKIWSVSRRRRADLIIVRDLPMCPAGIWVSRALNVPCIMDMAECYPEMLRCTWKFEGFKLKNFFARNPKLADLVERYCLKRLSKVLVMIDESRSRLLSMGVPSTKIVQVSNTPNIAVANRYYEAKSPSDEINIIYVGLINPSRGLDTVIEGAALLRDRDISFTLTIAGGGKDELRIKEMISQNKLGDRVRMLGWVDHSEIACLFSNATIGLVPHHICSHWNHTIPNKLFDYMAAGIPVVSSNVVPMKRLIKETNCGVVYADSDPASFADAIVSLLERSKRVELGECGRAAVLSEFNWDREEEALMEAVYSTGGKQDD